MTPMSRLAEKMPLVFVTEIKVVFVFVFAIICLFCCSYHQFTLNNDDDESLSVSMNSSLFSRQFLDLSSFQ